MCLFIYLLHYLKLLVHHQLAYILLNLGDFFFASVNDGIWLYKEK